MIRRLRLYLAHRKLWRAQMALARDVEQRRQSFITQDYVRRRTAALKFTRGARAAQEAAGSIQ